MPGLGLLRLGLVAVTTGTLNTGRSPRSSTILFDGDQIQLISPPKQLPVTTQFRAVRPELKEGTWWTYEQAHHGNFTMRLWLISGQLLAPVHLWKDVSGALIQFREMPGSTY